MPQATVLIDTSRVEFVEDNLLIGERVYRTGDVAEIPTDRLKELGAKVRSSDKELTDFSGKPTESKPKKT